MKNKILVFLYPLMFLALGVSLLIFNEGFLKDKINTVEVLVAAKDIEFKDEFTEDNLKVANIRRDNAINGSIEVDDIEEVENILGYYAAVDIKEGTQIYAELIDAYDLVPNENEGEFIASIPAEWIFSLPGSIRRSYVADFYLIPPNNSEETERLEEILNNMDDEESNNDENDKEQTEDDDEEEENEEVNVHSEEEQEEFIKAQIQNGNKPILKNIRLFAAKDNRNQEVMNLSEEEGTTGVISTIEVITNEEDLNLLKEYMSQGYQLYITYTYQRGNE